eukprot:gene10944-biopygen7668
MDRTQTSKLCSGTGNASLRLPRAAARGGPELNDSKTSPEVVFQGFATNCVSNGPEVASVCLLVAVPPPPKKRANARRGGGAPAAGKELSPVRLRPEPERDSTEPAALWRGAQARAGRPATLVLARGLGGEPGAAAERDLRSAPATGNKPQSALAIGRSKAVGHAAQAWRCMLLLVRSPESEGRNGLLGRTNESGKYCSSPEKYPGRTKVSKILSQSGKYSPSPKIFRQDERVREI